MRAVSVVLACALLLGAGSACNDDGEGDANADGGRTPDPDPSRPSRGASAAPLAATQPTPGAPAPTSTIPDPDEMDHRPDASAREAAPDAGQAPEAVAFPLHGVTFHFLAQVFGAPTAGSEVVGAMRRGARFRASERVAGDGCDDGWYAVLGGGYVCRGRGYVLGRTPQTFEPAPMAPTLEDPLPYPYAWVVRDRVPQYWRIPTPEEEATALAWLEAHPDAPPEGGRSADGGVTDAGVAPSPAVGANDAGTADGGAVDVGSPRPDFVRLVMRKGFYVSIDGDETTDDGRAFVRTVRGTYVPADSLAPVELSPAPGIALGGGRTLPLAFVYRDGPTRFRIAPESGALERDGHVARFSAFPVRGTRDVRGRPFVVGADGTLVREEAVRVVRRHDRPEDVPADARWIHVSLSQQTLVAYDGDRPVFATVVSTGRPGFETPAGLYRIQAKYVTTTMDDLAAEDPYLIEDVPWVMYFEGSYALHGAFWHHGFGRVRSHGCVNLAPGDAQWIFRWTTPSLPPAWHSVLSRAGRQGTYVLVEP